MARRIKGKPRKRKNNKLKIASVTGAYDRNDYLSDKATLQGVAGQPRTPKLIKSIQEIEARMKRRSW